MFRLKPTVILVRHGSTDLNSAPGGSPERVRGWLDVPLNEEGMQQAQVVADQVGRLPIKRIVSSDLQRAYATAQAIADVAKVPIEATSDLRPWNLGQLSGQPIDRVKSQMLDLEMKYPTINAPGGESFDGFLKRFLSKLGRLLQEAEATPDDGFIVAVAHTRNLRAAEAWIVPPSFQITPENMQQVFNREEQAEPGGWLLIVKQEDQWQARPAVLEGGAVSTAKGS